MMNCLASLVPFPIRQWISSTLGGIQTQEVSNPFAPYLVCCTKSSQFKISADAERGVDDLLVTFCRNRFYDRCPWSEYKSIGPEATTAVVKLNGAAVKPFQIATPLHEEGFDERMLDRPRQEARNKRRHIPYGKPADYPSILEGAQTQLGKIHWLWCTRVVHQLETVGCMHESWGVQGCCSSCSSVIERQRWGCLED